MILHPEPSGNAVELRCLKVRTQALTSRMLQNIEEIV